MECIPKLLNYHSKEKLLTTILNYFLKCVSICLILKLNRKNMFCFLSKTVLYPEPYLL